MTRVTELTPLLKRLQLGPMTATLPERIALARREQLDYASFLEIVLSDEVNRRAHRRIELRIRAAGFEETCRLEDFDWSAAITLDRRLLDAVFSLEFLAKHEHVLLVGPAGVGKTFLAQALDYIAWLASLPWSRPTPYCRSSCPPSTTGSPWPRSSRRRPTGRYRWSSPSPRRSTSATPARWPGTPR